MIPHIGFTAVTKFTSRATLRERSAPDPKYDYVEESAKVIERLDELATNDTQKMLVEFFDDKLAIAVSVLLAMDNLLNWSFEER